MKTILPDVSGKGLECRHVVYCPSPDGQHDLHVVKEYHHTAEGVRVPQMRCIPDYKREFWITREGYRNHEDKKEYEPLSRLMRFTTTQCQLVNAISKALYGVPGGHQGFRQIASSPYLYGCDIATTSLIKKEYETKWADCIHPLAGVAVLDIETDVIRGTGEIILITLSFKDRIITAINSSFIAKVHNPIDRIRKLIDKHLGKLKQARGFEVELVHCDSPGQCCAAIMERAHEWKPDFITIWNINYDLPRVASALANEGYNLADVFSDPCVPEEYRFYKYTEGKSQKVTQSGKVLPLHPADRWHIAECPASFYFIDAMCLYKRVRIAKGMEPSYALDDILNKHIGMGKLSIPEVEHLEKLAWHQAMQRDYPFDYVVYNIFDCIGVELLDEKTKDIASTFPILCGNSDFRNFTSNPRRIVDDMHYFYLEEQCVIGTTGQELTCEDDDLVVGMNDWIVTLRADHVDNNGVALIKELPNTRSMVRVHLADLDIEGTYPTEEEVLNIAKETTVRELSRIEGMEEKQQRQLGINLTGGVSNAVECCVTAFKLPTPTGWLAIAKTAGFA